jgi:alkanesulfonate monooxygenase SsuD/methylene tetrahydromethanopterin reductase-like flavin-dependent oxidoreductase (luciferase family)
MKLGVFDHMDRGKVPLDQFFEDRMRLIEAYDQAGFYGYHVAEHHATPLGVAPSPGVWLAAIAQRTKQLRFGALVYLLPLYHPIKLIEEVCMLDQMSRGRLMLGVGRGISPIELRYYDLDPEEAPGRFAESLEVLLCGLTSETLNFEGKFYNFRDVPMELTPYQQPRPPLWYGLGRPDHIPWCVQHKVNIAGNLPGAGMRVITDRYRKEWRDAGNDPADMPLMGVGRHVVVGQTDKEALEIARTGYGKWRESFLKLWIRHNQMPIMHAVFPETYEEAEAQGRAVAGTPEKVRAHLQRSIDEAGLNYMLCRFAFGDMERDASLYSLDLFTRHVMADLKPAEVSV